MTASLHDHTIPSPDPELRELKIVMKGGGIAFVGRISVMLLNVLFHWILARTYGSVVIGNIAIGLTVVNLASVFVLFGLHRGVLRYVAHYAGVNDNARLAGALITALRVYTITATIVTIAVLLNRSFLANNVFDKPELTQIITILAFSIPFIALSTILSSYLQALRLISFKILINIVSPLLNILGIFLIVSFATVSEEGVVYVLAGSSIVTAMIAIALTWKKYPLRSRQSKKPILQTRAMLEFSWPLLLTAILSTANAQSETLVLGALTTSDQVGIYFVAFKAMSLITIFLTAFNVIFIPMISELYAKGKLREIDHLYKTITRWAFTASLPIFLIIFIWSSEILNLYGFEFVAGSSVLRVLATAQIFWVLSGPCGWMLTMTGHPRYNLLNMVLTLSIALGLDFLLIPRYGAMGAAIGAAVSIFIVNIIRLIEVHGLLRMQPYTRSYFKPLLAGLGAAIIIIGGNQVFYISSLNWRLIVWSPLLICLYGLLLFFLRMESTDISILYSIILRMGISKDKAKRAIGLLSLTRKDEGYL